MARVQDLAVVRYRSGSGSGLGGIGFVECGLIIFGNEVLAHARRRHVS
jgi:hypothetical protein